ALTMNMGPYTNVDGSINFAFNALGPAAPTVTIFEPFTGLAFEVPAPSQGRPPLARRPTPALRKTRPRDTANLNPRAAAPRALAGATEPSDAVTAGGQV